MLPLALFFFSGILLLQVFSTLPPRPWVAAVLLCSIVTGLTKFHGHRLLIAFLLGFAWSLWYAHSIAAFSLPSALEDRPVWIQGKIISLPRISPFYSSFIFRLETLQNKILPATTSIQVAWPHTPHTQTYPLQVGDEWRFPVRLQRIQSTHNPGGFDFEAWAFQHGIRAKATVLARDKPLLIGKHPFSYGVTSLRQYIKNQALHYLPASSTSHWLLALMIGEHAGISQAQWEVLRNTGTNHLMAIAGLHLGFLAVFAHWMTVRLWRHPQLIIRLPTPQAAACASLLAVFIYSTLAGFSIPTQRALIMITVYLLATFYRRVLAPWQAWSLALLLVLLLNPLSVLTQSFWLSFATLALIIYSFSGRLAPRGWWWKWGRPQWVLALGLLPLSLWFFMQYSLVSFVANMLAIPWVGFLILPFCFLSVIFLLICPGLAVYSLLLADKSLALLWSLLTFLSHLSWATWQQALPYYGYLISATIGVLILLLPSGFPGRGLGMLWLLPAFIFKPPTPAWGELHFSLLDVGQGLSAVIQTEHHVLVFDAGSRRSAEADQGERVVLPYLHSQGISRVDMLVISHGDNDHSGGAQAILKQLPVSLIETSVPQLFSAWPAAYCVAGKSWDWDGVHFSFLHPGLAQLNQGNDSSCVLRVSTEKNRILLPGDIEKAAENFLLADPSNDLAADVLVAPHHGSKTSGLRSFIGRVHPQYVLYAIGYHNRYHFPSATVAATYQELGSHPLDTASSGAIQFALRKEKLVLLDCYRISHKYYWNPPLQ